MFVALDLSLKSTGFACWSEGQQRPRCGIWQLSSLEFAGRAFVRLHRNLIDLHKVEPITSLMWEEALPHWAVKGQTSLATIKALAGLTAHALSFAEAVGARWSEVNQSVWRREFIGAMPRGTKTTDLKRMAMLRCRELGFDPEKHDAAEACGILDHQVTVSGITPPWRIANPLVRPLHPFSDGQAAA